MSLEYSMFRFSDDYPTAEGLSEMIMQVCMDDSRDRGVAGQCLRALVNAAYQLRTLEQLAETDEDEVNVPEVSDPECRFLDRYARACRAMRERCDDGDAWWEDWWPTDCPWHPDDIARLARLKAGETASVRRQLRAMWATDKENTDA